MQLFAFGVVVAAAGLLLYTYFGYPAVLAVLGRLRRRRPVPDDPAWAWPRVSISVPAYNEEDQIRDLIRSLLALDYPKDRLQILIISDASSDATDDIVREYAAEGVELLRMPERGGKTKAENAAAERLDGEIILNTDASIRIRPDALKPLVAAFRDPRVGCASGRDVSVGAGEAAGSGAAGASDGNGGGGNGAAGGNVGEGGYVGYEMWVRDLETRVGGIIGASGCFYAIRPHLHRLPLPGSLSRDFAAALHTHEHGYRAISVPEAVCYVPRAPALKKEYPRKVRTITRGMQTLWHKRALMNPLRHGLFAWKLLSHKVCRWALPWAAIAALLALGVMAPAHPVALVAFLLGVVVLALAAAGWALADRPSVPRILSIPAYVVMGNLSAAHAFLRAFQGGRDALWEPTRRHVVKAE